MKDWEGNPSFQGKLHELIDLHGYEVKFLIADSNNKLIAYLESPENW